MQKFTKKDLLMCLVTGMYAGVIAWRVFEFLQLDIFNKLRINIIFNLLGLPLRTNISSAWFIILVPVIWIIGVNFGYFLGRWMPFFNQFGRFAVIGFTNFIVYSGMLNLLIGLTSISSGLWYSIFVGISFTAGALHSYFWNKYWVFDFGSTNSGGAEFGKFVAVSIASGLLNVIVASFLVNFIHPLFGITPQGWANVGGIAGSTVGLVFNFIGLRIVVFRKPVSSI